MTKRFCWLLVWLALSGRASFAQTDMRSLSDTAAARAARQLELRPSPTVPNASRLIAADDERRYMASYNITVPSTDGVKVCVSVLRPRRVSTRIPALLRFTIYADSARDHTEARLTAAHGYAAVTGYTRGKMCGSPMKPVPYVHDADDATAVINWIARQPWSNGQVGMYSGSYEGFTQWAALKRMPRALKAIMAGAPAAPGLDVPMEGNIVWSFVYPWTFYATNNRTLDTATYNNSARWQKLNRDWYLAGGAYRDLEKIDGTPNPYFAEWLAHPAYDKYWQSMIPYGEEFARINIPVLQTAGYFYGGPGAAVYYFTQHYKYRPNAEHYLVIGPYTHFEAQRGVVDVFGDTAEVIWGYRRDRAAWFSIVNDLRYQWFDYVLKHKARPALLQDKVNYQVMGANVWKHAPSIAAMSNDTLRLDLVKDSAVVLRVNLADRSDVDAAPIGGGVLDSAIDTTTGVKFVSDVVHDGFELSGLFRGELHFITSKKDFDFQVNLYEQMADGKYFQIPFLQLRASYAEDPSKRKLLQPGVPQVLHFQSIRLVSRKFSPGSRIVTVISVLRNGIQQINYGSGKDVNEETIKDAGEPLQIKLLPGTYIDVPNCRDL